MKDNHRETTKRDKIMSDAQNSYSKTQNDYEEKQKDVSLLFLWVLVSCSYEGWHGVFYMFLISLFLSRFITFFLPFFHFFLYTIFPLCHLSPLSVPCNATDGLCERWGRSQRISIYLTPVCPSSSSHSLIYHTQVLFYCCLAAGFQPMACLSKPLSSLLWASVGNKPTYLHFLCTKFSVTVCKTLLNLKARILSDIVIQELYDQVQVIHKDSTVLSLLS